MEEKLVTCEICGEKYDSNFWKHEHFGNEYEKGRQDERKRILEMAEGMRGKMTDDRYEWDDALDALIEKVQEKGL